MVPAMPLPEVECILSEVAIPFSLLLAPLFYQGLVLGKVELTLVD